MFYVIYVLCIYIYSNYIYFLFCFYMFQAYSIIIQHLYILQSDQHLNSSYHPSQHTVDTLHPSHPLQTPPPWVTTNLINVLFCFVDFFS